MLSLPKIAIAFTARQLLENGETLSNQLDPHRPAINHLRHSLLYLAPLF